MQQDIVVDEDSDSLLQVSQLAQQQFNDDDFDDEQQASSGDDLPFVPTESTSKRIKIGSQHQAILPALQERPKTCTEERPDTLVYSPHVLKPEQGTCFAWCLLFVLQQMILVVCVFIQQVLTHFIVESFEKQCASIVGAQRLNREKVLNLLHQQNYHVEAALEVVRAQPYDFESDNDWTPKERAKAIYAIQFFKRNFVKVAKYVQTRSVGEVIDFYYKSKGHKRQALEDIRVHVDMAADEHLQQTQGLALRRQVVEVHSEEEDDDSDESDGDEQQVFPPLNSLQHHHFHQVVGNHKPVHSIIGMPTTTTTSSSPVLLLPNHVQPVANTITLPRGKLKDWSQTDMEQVVGKVFEDEFDMEQPDDTAVLLDSSSESDQYDNESVAQRVELSMPLALKHVHDNPPQLDALHDVMNKL